MCGAMRGVMRSARSESAATMSTLGREPLGFTRRGTLSTKPTASSASVMALAASTGGLSSVPASGERAVARRSFTRLGSSAQGLRGSASHSARASRPSVSTPCGPRSCVTRSSSAFLAPPRA